MIVNKPRNNNDTALEDNGLNHNLPLHHATDMSYFLQRIRLAEISRGIVDNYYANISSMPGEWDGASSYASISIMMDEELKQFLKDLPSFFKLETYTNKTLAALCRNTIFIQAYMINSLVNTQRCKLALGFITTYPKYPGSAYQRARQACLEAAQNMIRAEEQLEGSRHPFTQVRLRLSGMMYGVFLAGIALLMMMNTIPTQKQQANEDNNNNADIRGVDVAKALRIIESIKGHSLAAANLHEALTQMLARHGQRTQQKGDQSEPSCLPPISSASQPFAQPPQPTSGPIVLGDENQPPAPWTTSPLPPSQGLEELMDMESFQWDELVSGMDTSGFF